MKLQYAKEIKNIVSENMWLVIVVSLTACFCFKYEKDIFHNYFVIQLLEMSLFNN